MFLDIAHHIIKIDYTFHIDLLGGGKIIDIYRRDAMNAEHSETALEDPRERHQISNHSLPFTCIVASLMCIASYTSLLAIDQARPTMLLVSV